MSRIFKSRSLPVLTLAAASLTLPAAGQKFDASLSDALGGRTSNPAGTADGSRAEGGVQLAHQPTAKPNACGTTLAPVLIRRDNIGSHDYQTPDEPFKFFCNGVHVSFNAAAGAINADSASRFDQALTDTVIQALGSGNFDAPVWPQQNPSAVFAGKKAEVAEANVVFHGAPNPGIGNRSSWAVTLGVPYAPETPAEFFTVSGLRPQNHSFIFADYGERANEIPVITGAMVTAEPEISPHSSVRLSALAGYAPHGARGPEGQVDVTGNAYGFFAGANFWQHARTPDTSLVRGKDVHAGYTVVLPRKAGGFTVGLLGQYDWVLNAVAFSSGETKSATGLLFVSKDYAWGSVYFAGDLYKNNQPLGGVTAGDYTAYGGGQKAVESGTKFKLPFVPGVSLLFAEGVGAPFGSHNVRPETVEQLVETEATPWTGNSPHKKGYLFGVEAKDIPLPRLPNFLHRPRSSLSASR